MVATGFFIFIICSVLGWIWEVLLNIFLCGVFVNRGILYGPWLPIYGFGAVLVLIIALNVNNPFQVFLISAASCGLLEYLTSYIMEYVWKMRWWNYSGAWNVNGRINLLVILLFGCIGLFFHYIIVPQIDWIKLNIAGPFRFLLAVMLLIIMTDFIYAQIHPNISSISSHHPF